MYAHTYIDMYVIIYTHVCVSGDFFKHNLGWSKFMKILTAQGLSNIL